MNMFLNLIFFHLGRGMWRLLFRRILLNRVPGRDGEGCQVRQRERKVLRLQPLGPILVSVLQRPHASSFALRQSGN